MASRQSRRAGFGELRGAINPPVAVSEVPPRNPSVKDLWVSTYEDKFYRWDGAAWVETAGIGPIKIWTGTEAGYTALGTYDDATLYFCTAT
jgi:hypothetical protein